MKRHSMPSRFPPARLDGRIRQLEGPRVRAAPVALAPSYVVSPELRFIRVRGVSRFWERGRLGVEGLQERQARLLTGLADAQMGWAYAVVGEGEQLSVFLGFPCVEEPVEAWGPVLGSLFPGAEFGAGPATASLVDNLASLPCAGLMTGNPSRSRPEKGPDGPAQFPATRLEALFHALHKGRWAYVVVGEPVATDSVEKAVLTLADEQQELVSSHLRPGSAEEKNNPQAARCLELLKAARERHEEGTREGMWTVSAFLLADNPQHLAVGTQTLLGAFAGPDSKPEPVRVHRCRLDEGPEAGQVPSTRLTTREAATLAHLPSEEFVGYQVREMVRFAVFPPQPDQAERLALGLVLDDGRRTEQWFEVGLDALAKHVLVAGVPGSGKTQTCQYLLRQLWEEHQVPWLVLEPSMKSEWRSLLAGPDCQDVRVFTLGDATCVPFRLNPLEVLPGVPVQTHIDGLVALFNAAFAFVTPMPYVLNLALYRVYTDRGWDLAGASGHSPEDRPEQPTLSDLTATVARLVGSLGYDPEITANIRAGLLTRLGSLTAGGKGLMLDGSASVPMDYLLSGPTVLEFSAIGNDEDKAFILGAMLLRLAEYRQWGGATQGRLRHVTLVEEAHRLLAAAPQHAPSEEANPRGKAVETFCHLLSEIRAYGEGIVVVDQIPTKLAPDVLKNTNLKVAHRLVAKPEREAVAGCMNLEEAQQRRLATLECGEAVAYAEGCEGAFLVRVPDHARHHGLAGTPISDEEVARRMREKLPPEIASLLSSKPKVLAASENSSCPGCSRDDCPVSRQVFEHLMTVDHAEEFSRALDGGWKSLWAFGARCAGLIWRSGPRPADAPYCVLMTLAALMELDAETADKMRHNLEVLRQEAKGRTT